MGREELHSPRSLHWRRQRSAHAGNQICLGTCADPTNHPSAFQPQPVPPPVRASFCSLARPSGNWPRVPTRNASILEGLEKYLWEYRWEYRSHPVCVASARTFPKICRPVRHTPDMYIRQEQLPRLEEYKYSGVDRSLLSKYILKPFYTHVAIKAFPMAMAPNAITLSGFAFVVLNFLTLLWYNPTLDQDCPAWVYVSWSVGLFLYQTFDAVDGAQARRTRQSGPLGELFDHGVDALNTTLEVLLFAATMNMGQSWKTVLVLFACLFTFYIQTWDEYHTHTLYLGLVSGPVEGIMTLIIVFGLTAMLGGGHFWQQSLVGSLGVSQQAAGERLFNLNWSDWFMGYGGVVLVFNTAQR